MKFIAQVKNLWASIVREHMLKDQSKKLKKLAEMDNFRGLNRNLCWFSNFHASLGNLAHFLWKISLFLMLNCLKSCFLWTNCFSILFDVEQRTISRKKNLEMQENFFKPSLFTICYQLMVWYLKNCLEPL
jgi:hypothetical protein